MDAGNCETSSRIGFLWGRKKCGGVRKMNRCLTFVMVLMAVAATNFLLRPVLAQTAGQSNADEVAKSLSNPNTPLASLNFENGFTWYKGDLPGADDQTTYRLLFQPVLPFPLSLIRFSRASFILMRATLQMPTACFCKHLKPIPRT